MKRNIFGCLVVAVGIMLMGCPNPPDDSNLQPDSTNADLSALSVDIGTLTPAFTSGTTNYTVGVSNAATTITVVGTKADSNAAVAISPAQPLALSVGANTIAVTVTAQSGTTKEYTVIVTRGYAIGDTGPSGVGIVFYVTDGGLHGLEVAPSVT
jgi:hypothetical protein